MSNLRRFINIGEIKYSKKLKLLVKGFTTSRSRSERIQTQQRGGKKSNPLVVYHLNSLGTISCCRMITLIVWTLLSPKTTS
jgi:hypothetical protein